MDPIYFETHFRLPGPMPCWPHDFVIVSAFATTGQTWTQERNKAADLDLHAELAKRGCWIARLIGFSSTTGHAEPSWTAEIDMGDGCDLGLRYHQDAIYHVLNDQLSVSYCDSRRELVPVGRFRERLHGEGITRPRDY
jgi:hypothetical protein